MARGLNKTEKAMLVTTTLGAAEVLMKKFNNSVLYRLFYAREVTEHVIVDIRNVHELPETYTDEEKVQVARWLRKRRGFRVFMSLAERARWPNLVVELEKGKLVFHSVTPVQFPLIRPMR